MRAEVCQLDLEPLGLCLFPFQPSWRLLLWFQREIGISKSKAPPRPHFLKYQQSGNFHRCSLPDPQFDKGQPRAHATKREHTFPMEESHGSLALGTLFPIQPLLCLKSDKTTQKMLTVRLFLLVVEQSGDGTALMRSY